MKTFPELSDAELDRYIDANVARPCGGWSGTMGEPDAALANHLIMGPVILARAGLRFAIKVHGSDLSYTVLPHPERFVPLAREGTDAASGVLVGSRHTAEDPWETVATRRSRGPASARPAWTRRVRGSREGADGAAAASWTTWSSAGAGAGAAAEAVIGPPAPRPLGRAGWRRAIRGSSSSASCSSTRAWTCCSPPGRWSCEPPRGAPAAGGFGGYRAGAGGALAALGRGPGGGRRARGVEGGRAPRPSGGVSPPAGGLRGAARSTAGSAWRGRLEHAEVAEVMPASQTLVMPITFPEAFGMVAAEAAACGVPPVSADHSGMREVSAPARRGRPGDAPGSSRSRSAWRGGGDRERSTAGSRSEAERRVGRRPGRPGAASLELGGVAEGVSRIRLTRRGPEDCLRVARD